MGWSIKCSDGDCGDVTLAGNNVELMDRHCDEEGWFRCAFCEGAGHIEKSFKLQEKRTVWQPYLGGVVRLSDDPKDTYQPFVFLGRYSSNEPPSDVWFSYFQDTRASGGKLKLGYGPGVTPVLGTNQVLKLVGKLKKLGMLPGVGDEQ